MHAADVLTCVCVVIFRHFVTHNIISSGNADITPHRYTALSVLHRTAVSVSSRPVKGFRILKYTAKLRMNVHDRKGQGPD